MCWHVCIISDMCLSRESYCCLNTTVCYFPLRFNGACLHTLSEDWWRRVFRQCPPEIIKVLVSMGQPQNTLPVGFIKAFKVDVKTLLFQRKCMCRNQCGFVLKSIPPSLVRFLTRLPLSFISKSWLVLSFCLVVGFHLRIWFFCSRSNIA